MKIYFGFTVAGDRSSLAAARRIVTMLEDQGHEVLTRHLLNDDARDADRRIGPQGVYSRDLAWLQECEMFIAEVSGSSFGLGFEAGYLLGATEKPVVLLYHAEAEPKISLMITGNTHPRCTLIRYDEIQQAESVVSSKLTAHRSWL